MTQWRTAEMEERLMRWRRKGSIYCALSMPPFFIEDLFSGGKNTLWLVLIKALWGLVLLAVGLALPYVGPQSRRNLIRLSAFTAALCMSGIAILRGDHQTAYFAWLFALPFCVVLMTQDEVGAAVICSATTFAGATFILLRAGPAPSDAAQWLLCIATVCGLAIYGSVQMRAHRREEYLLQREGLVVLEKLADSERQRAEAERMALVGQLAAGVAHEINNPLAVVISNMSFIEGEFTTPSPDPDERDQVLLETNLGLRRVKAIVHDLTAFARVEEDKTTAVDLNAVVTEAERAASIRTRGCLGVINELPAELGRVLGNQRHLSQVFLNLILNAVDARGSQPGGKLWIRSTLAEDGLRIDVEDDGPGFTTAVHSSLFQPFFTTKAPGKGTGLGLATSREYMRRAGGDLVAQQRPGGGARFTIALRFAPRG